MNNWVEFLSASISFNATVDAFTYGDFNLPVRQRLFEILKRHCRLNSLKNLCLYDSEFLGKAARKAARLAKRQKSLAENYVNNFPEQLH